MPGVDKRRLRIPLGCSYRRAGLWAMPALGHKGRKKCTAFLNGQASNIIRWPLTSFNINRKGKRINIYIQPPGGSFLPLVNGYKISKYNTMYLNLSSLEIYLPLR